MHMSKLRAFAPLIAVLSGGLWGCADDGLSLEESSAASSNGDGDGDSNSEESQPETGGDGDGDEEPPCVIFETTEIEGCAEIVGEGFCSEGGVHVDQDSEIPWSNNPPHSGDHYPTWETWGEHEESVMRGNWVHNMEHGGIALIYNCPEGCEEELEVLRAVLEMRNSVLMTEDALLDGPRFAALSWTWVHEFDEPVLDELLCFVDQHYDHAPESVL